ncbi:MAG: alpha/beta hydrolase-fold protein [Bacteroidales bacterium]
MRLRWIVWLFMFLGHLQMAGQSFSDFLNFLSSLPPAQRQVRVDSFMAVHPQTPFIENDTLCHFIYLGPAQKVQTAGDFTNWSYFSDLAQVEGTTLWYYTRSFETDARLDYKLIINSNQWILDPKNPYTCAGGFGPNSELRMPAYVPPEETQYNAGVPHGQILDTTFYSQYLKNSRKIWIYKPAGYNPEKRYPVVYVHDGDGYLALAAMRNVLDNLITWGQLQPLMAVFIPPVDRTEEYAGSKQSAFTDFMVKELVPWVDGRFSTLRHPWGRANLGASNGGNISLWLTVSNPDVFGLVAAMSSNVENNITLKVQQGVTPPVKFYLDIGTYDIPILIQRVGDFRQLLENNGEVFFFQQFNEGHSWGNWKAHIDDALIFLFGAVGSSGYHPEERIRVKYIPDLKQISLDLPQPVKQELICLIYDVMGRMHDNYPIRQGLTTCSFTLDNYKPGLYFVHIENSSFATTHKMWIY